MGGATPPSQRPFGSAHRVEVGGDFVAEVEAACEGAGLMAEHCG